MEPEAAGRAASLNEPQQRHLRVSCQYIDKLLTDALGTSAPAATASPFSRYFDDLTPVQKRVLYDYVGRIRSLMMQMLETQGLDAGAGRVSARHAIRTALGFVGIAVEELKPRYMRGYGGVPPAAEPALNGIVVELQGIVRALDAFLARSGAEDLQARIGRLGREAAGRETLALLEQVIGAHGLVEFRPALAMILDRLEDMRFEVAVFGRVSTGKSSLLNHIIGSTRLPIGVTPITAVPTRIAYGAAERVGVWFAERPMSWVDAARLAEFVTEEDNPGNVKHVTRIVFELPSPRLREGVVLVDTPGLGSLATEGAAETLAYLPRCDYAVVLIDAGTAPSADDLRTIRMLLDAGIPVSVLLSKADLLETADLDRLRRYVDEQVRRELETAVPIRPVSVTGERAALLEEWLEADLLPLLARHRELVHESLRRKTAVLRENIVATLRVMLEREPQGGAGAQPAPAASVDLRLRTAAAAFEEARDRCDTTCELVRRLAEPAYEEAARIATAGDQPPVPAAALRGVLEAAVEERASAIEQDLTTVGATATQALAAAAREIGAPIPEPDEVFRAGLRERPRFVAPPLSGAAVGGPLRLFGRPVARHRLAGRLRHLAGREMQERLDAHAALLRDWTLAALRQMRGAYLAQADAFRAQLERRPVSEEGRDALRRDLDALQAQDR